MDHAHNQAQDPDEDHCPHTASGHTNETPEIASPDPEYYRPEIHDDSLPAAIGSEDSYLEP